jgi:hypothetical protein
MTSLLEFPILDYAITRYIILLLILKLYTYWPILIKRGQSIEIVNLKSVKRCDNVADVLFAFTSLFLLFFIWYLLSGIFHIIIGDSFYDAFNNYATEAEAIADEEEKGKFNYGSYSLFKFTIRASLVNVIVGIPLFGLTKILDYNKK